jgi:hypothetical protein
LSLYVSDPSGEDCLYNYYEVELSNELAINTIGIIYSDEITETNHQNVLNAIYSDIQLLDKTSHTSVLCYAQQKGSGYFNWYPDENRAELNCSVHGGYTGEPESKTISEIQTEADSDFSDNFGSVSCGSNLSYSTGISTRYLATTSDLSWIGHCVHCCTCFPLALLTKTNLPEVMRISFLAILHTHVTSICIRPATPLRYI